jgi:hypothetical protein
MIDKAGGAEIPVYGWFLWASLPEGDPRRVAAVVLAAELYAQQSDTLIDDLCREVEAARLAHKQAEDADYQARVAAHRKLAPRHAKSFAQRRAEQLALSDRPDRRPQAGEFGWETA